MRSRSMVLAGPAAAADVGPSGRGSSRSLRSSLREAGCEPPVAELANPSRKLANSPNDSCWSWLASNRSMMFWASSWIVAAAEGETGLIGHVNLLGRSGHRRSVSVVHERSKFRSRPSWGSVTQIIGRISRFLHWPVSAGDIPAQRVDNRRERPSGGRVADRAPFGNGRSAGIISQPAMPAGDAPKGRPAWKRSRASRTSSTTAGCRPGRSTPAWWSAARASGALLAYEFVVLTAQAVPGALGLALRKVLYPRLLGACGRNVVFGQNVVLRHPHKIRIGNDVVIDDNCLLDAKGESNAGITIGSGVFLGRNTILSCKNGDIELGDFANLGFNCEIFSGSRVTVGANALFAAYCYLIGGDHDRSDTSVPVSQQRRTSKGVQVGAGVWMGAGAKVMDGVTIGADAIVGAGAVVQDRRARAGGGGRHPGAAGRRARTAGAGGAGTADMSRIAVVTSGQPFGAGGHLEIAERPGAGAARGGAPGRAGADAAEPVRPAGRGVPGDLADGRRDGAGRRPHRPGDHAAVPGLRACGTRRRSAGSRTGCASTTTSGMTFSATLTPMQRPKERDPPPADPRRRPLLPDAPRPEAVRHLGRDPGAARALGRDPVHGAAPAAAAARLPLRRLRRLHLRGLAADAAEAARPAGAGAGRAGRRRRPLRDCRRRRAWRATLRELVREPRPRGPGEARREPSTPTTWSSTWRAAGPSASRRRTRTTAS